MRGGRWRWRGGLTAGSSCPTTTWCSLRLVCAKRKASPGLGRPRAEEPRPDFYLGPLRSVRPHRVAVVAAAEPAEQAAGVLSALGSLRHGRWWPPLEEVIDAARRFYPDSLAEDNAALAGGPAVSPDDPDQAT